MTSDLRERLSKALDEIHWNLIGRALIHGGHSYADVMKALQDEWYRDGFEKARNGSEPPDAGNHHTPELGREERAFYHALTASQREAYDQLREALRNMTPEQWSRFNPFVVDPIIDNWRQAAMILLAPQAMRSYLVGQLLAAQQMGTAQHLPMGEQDKRAIDFLSHYQFNEIAQSFDNLKSDLRRALISGMQEGRHPVEVGRQIGRELDDYKTQWDVVAITETARAQTQGRLQEYLDEGLTHVEFSTANDPRVCEQCRRFEGVIVPIAQVYGKSNYRRQREDWLPVPPVHPRCRCVLLAYVEDDMLARVTKVVDDQGRKHDELGRFASTSSPPLPETAKYTLKQVILGRVTTAKPGSILMNVAANRLLGNPDFFGVPKDIREEFKEENSKSKKPVTKKTFAEYADQLRELHEHTKSEWNRLFPEGRTLYRGISPKHGDDIARRFYDKSENVMTFRPVLSTSSSRGVGMHFAREALAHPGEVTNVVQFDRVKGDRVIGSIDLPSQADVYKDSYDWEHETSILGADNWKINDIKVGEYDDPQTGRKMKMRFFIVEPFSYTEKTAGSLFKARTLDAEPYEGED